MSDKKNVESILAELGKRIDHLIVETKKAGDKVSRETEEKIQELKVQKEKLEEKMRGRSSGLRGKWSNAREHLNNAADDMRKAFIALFDRDHN